MESGDGSSSREPSVKNSGDMSGCGCGAGGANSGGTNSTTNPGSGTSTGSGTQNISTAQVEESILVRVTPTTGGQFDILVCKNESVENLKKRLSKKLKVPKERICLLHRDRQLREGSLHENQLVDGSRLTLLPSVETGLLAQRPEQSVMQALESLNDSQVNDFLSGKAPLNLTMRLGDHMMLIQLQLSTVTPKLSSSSSSSSSTNSSSSTSRSSTLRNSSSSSNTSPISSPRQPAHRQQATPSSQQPATPTTAAAAAAAAASPPTPSQTKCRCDPSKQPALDTRALAEASRNLTQTLKQLSSEVLTSRSGGSSSSSSTSSSSATPVMSSSTSSMDFSEVRRTSTSSSTSNNQSSSSTRSSRNNQQTSSSSPSMDYNTESSRRRQGAIIESMHHHGKGVYSGTFSGTLNPALQDKFGRPKRDISTIIHILNDLLCATPQYRGATATSATVSNSSSSSRRHNAAQQQSDAAALNDHDYAEGCEGSAQLSKENQATRGKMEQLRQFMEERRARRRARREARVAPYSAAQWAASKTAPSGSTSPVMSPAAPVEGRPCEARASIAASATDGNPATPMDTSEGAGAELCELNPEPVLA